MKFLRFMAGLICGAFVGGITALLLTPQSGEEMQGTLHERTRMIMEEGRRAAAERRAELEAQFAEAKRVRRS